MALLSAIQKIFQGKGGRPAGPDMGARLEERGFQIVEEEDGSLTVTTPDEAFVCVLSMREKCTVVRLRQKAPYRVLFSYQDGKYYVNDDNEDGYIQLLERLRHVRRAPDLLNAAGEFLLGRYSCPEKA